MYINITKAEWEEKLKKELNEYDPDGDIYQLVKNKIKMAGVCFEDDKKYYEHYTSLVKYFVFLINEPVDFDIKIMAEFFTWVFDIKIMAEFFTWVMEYYWDKEMEKWNKDA